MKNEATTKFGLGQIGNHTPQWATWAFRIVMYTCSLLILALTTLNVGRLGLTASDINDLTALLSFLIMAAHGLSKLIGTEVNPEDYKAG